MINKDDDEDCDDNGRSDEGEKNTDECNKIPLELNKRKRKFKENSFTNFCFF